MTARPPRRVLAVAVARHERMRPLELLTAYDRETYRLVELCARLERDLAALDVEEAHE